MHKKKNKDKNKNKNKKKKEKNPKFDSTWRINVRYLQLLYKNRIEKRALFQFLQGKIKTLLTLPSFPRWKA